MTQRRQQSHLFGSTEPVAHRRVSDKTLPISRDVWLHQNLACKSENRYVTNCVQGNAWVHNPSLRGRQQRSPTVGRRPLLPSILRRARNSTSDVFSPRQPPRHDLAQVALEHRQKHSCPLFKLRHRASQRQHMSQLSDAPSRSGGPRSCSLRDKCNYSKKRLLFYRLENSAKTTDVPMSGSAVKSRD